MPDVSKLISGPSGAATEAVVEGLNTEESYEKSVSSPHCDGCNDGLLRARDGPRGDGSVMEIVENGSVTVMVGVETPTSLKGTSTEREGTRRGREGTSARRKGT